jgi:alanyl-tRNA synthetase
MGDTGPCGPCSELHVDLTPLGKTRGSLVNAGDALCIEIWNLVFIQFNANPDGTFSPLPARHVDTGMGFERITAMMQGTKNFSDFSSTASNYETDIFRPIFDEIEKLSGKHYGSTLPKTGQPAASEQEKIDIAFRVIADHIRTLSFAIADGVRPSNEGRGYVLRRILRRAVRYGRSLGFHEPFFFQLVDILARTMGGVFPELRAKQTEVTETLRREEEAFNKTLDRGIEVFQRAVELLDEPYPREAHVGPLVNAGVGKDVELIHAGEMTPTAEGPTRAITGEFAFKLYDTYGFPLDLTELMARERGLTVDVAGFEKLMKEQRARGRSAQKKEVIAVSNVGTNEPTHFLGYEHDHTGADVQSVVDVGGKRGVVLNNSVLYAEMGGQVADRGQMIGESGSWKILDTRKSGETWIHLIEGENAPAIGEHVTVRLDRTRRSAIERHHTVTHLLHWALHEIVSHDATQKGSYVGPDKLTFDFSSSALTKKQVHEIEKLVNEKIAENAPVSWTEIPYPEAKAHADIMQFFGDKYGDRVRVVQIGGLPNELNGYSMELCGGTHVRTTGDIGYFRIRSEGAIAASIRRIDAIAGNVVGEWARGEADGQEEKFQALLKKKPGLSPLPEFVSERSAEMVASIEERAAHLERLETDVRAWEKANLKATEAGLQSRAVTIANELAASDSAPFRVARVPDADGKLLHLITDALKTRFDGPIFLAGEKEGRVALIASVPKALTARYQAGKLIQETAPLVGGKGGGRSELAQGGGTDATKIEAALAKVKALLS